MGSLVKCAACGERCGERPVGVYWRWMRADNVWKAYYARICVGCYAAKVLPLDVEYPGDARLTCPGCGADTEDDYDALYTTSFPGKGPQLDTESPFCPACIVPIKAWVQGFARDTDDVDGAAQPRQQAGAPDQATASETMKALGRQTRVR